MLKLTNVKKSYDEPGGGSLPILEVNHFEMGAGEQVVLRGPSGCGKSTLLHVIAGISKADSGQVEINGVDIARLPEAARDRFRARNIGYVFQTFNLLTGFTALENVLLGMTFTGQKVDQDRAKSLLERVGLSHRLSHQPSMLSVGEQQRVAVARAMANKPRLLLADEPTANVDRGHQQQVVDLIRETCRAEDVALLLVTHTDEVSSQFERVEKLEELNQLARTAT